jgi:hypothetical protein
MIAINNVGNANEALNGDTANLGRGDGVLRAWLEHFVRCVSRSGRRI